MTFNFSSNQEENIYRLCSIFVQASQYFDQIGALLLPSFASWGNSLREYNDLLRLLLVNLSLSHTMHFLLHQHYISASY